MTDTNKTTQEAKTKLERLQAQKEKITKKLREEKAKVSKATRKGRNKKLIMAGLLVEMAGLADFDQGAVLGWLIRGKEALKDRVQFMDAKRAGDEELKRREVAKEKKTTAAPKPAAPATVDSSRSNDQPEPANAENAPCPNCGKVLRVQVWTKPGANLGKKFIYCDPENGGCSQTSFDREG